MRSCFVIFYALLTGCSPILDAQLRLIDASRKGVTEVKQSLDERQQLLASLQAARRKQLDAAFDADIKAQPTLTDAYVIEARQAYSAALDAYGQQEQTSQQAATATKANLDAIDAALAQMKALNEAEANLKFPILGGAQ